MTDWIDISMALSPTMATWPGNAPPKLDFPKSFDRGASSISSILTTNEHNGTHIDAPLHFIPGGEPVDAQPVHRYIGDATVVDVGDVAQITAELLEKLVPSTVDRLLLKTRNSARRLLDQPTFDESFVALTTDAAQWIVDHHIALVGIDYLSIALYQGDAETHRALLRSNVGILEGVVLHHVEPGEYDLICLPLKIEGGEAAPARAVVRPKK